MPQQNRRRHETVCSQRSYLKYPATCMPDGPPARWLAEWGPTCMQVCLLSAQAGGAGLNLIGANRLVLLDSNWCAPARLLHFSFALGSTPLHSLYCRALVVG